MNKKMKVALWSASVISILSFSSCTNHDEMNLPVPSDLSIEAGVVQNHETVETRASVSGTKFPNGSKLGLFVTGGTLGSKYDGLDYKNVSATLSTTTWTMAPAVPLSATKATVFGYYPYDAANASNDGTTIPVKDHQTDYLYATSSNQVNNETPGAVMNFKHAMTYLQIVLKKGSYSGAGSLTAATVSNTAGALIKLNGTMNISTGAVAGGTASSLTWTTLPATVTAAGASSEWMMAPLATTAADGIKFSFTIDGKVFTYNVPASTAWEAGKRNIYTLTLNGTSFVINNADISITDWVNGVIVNTTIN